MKPERIEELARLAYEAAAGAHRQAWDRLSDVWEDDFRMIARTLYAAAMRDAAGVAEGAYYQECCGEGSHAHGCCGSPIQAWLSPQEIAAALETIAKETDSDNG